MPELLLAPVALVVLGALALASATGDRVLLARASGRPLALSTVSPLPEVARLLVQRRRTTPAPDALLWRVGGGGLLVVAALMMAVVPLGGRVVADLPVGVVWFNAMDVLLWALVWLLGWGAASATALVAGYRYLAQALAYELPLMFALIPPALAAASLDVRAVVAAQQDRGNVVEMPIAFAVFLLCVAAFAFWGPLSAPAGGDVAGGVLAEVSGVDRLLVLAGRHALLAAGAAFAVPLFLGGDAGPLLPGWLWQLGKTLAVLAVLLVIRRRLPVLRPERFAELGWLVLIPLTLVQVFLTSLLVLGSAS
ncbi:MAG: NADH-quinone oxidoreductase subunit H [Mycobacteriales bacterium]